MQNIHLEFVPPHVARFKRAKKYAQQLSGITAKGLSDIPKEEVRDLLSSLRIVIARLEARMIRLDLT